MISVETVILRILLSVVYHSLVFELLSFDSFYPSPLHQLVYTIF
jgi:hypothetical protein